MNLLDRKASFCHGDETVDEHMSIKCPERILYIFERQNLGASREVKSWGAGFWTENFIWLKTLFLRGE